MLTLPALAALRARYPGCTITYAGNGAMLPLVPVEEALSADDTRLLPLFEEAPRMWAEFDLAISFSKVPFGLQRDPLDAVHRGVHVADWLVDAIYPGFPDRTPRLGVPAGAGTDLALLPGAGSPAKRWPAERFASAAKALSSGRLAATSPPHTAGAAGAAQGASGGATIALVEGPADRDAVAAVLACGVNAEVWRGLTLAELAARLAGSRLVIGNDSGVTHLAAAVGAPTVGLYVSTNPSVWGIRAARTRRLSGPDVAVEDVVSNGTAIAA
ncbi:MAG: glycosyltransferase family 9 protein [Chloroflexi bacterium]|nr:glycosyltransferase family 9 protein [Chloroflexota bacterium]